MTSPLVPFPRRRRAFVVPVIVAAALAGGCRGPGGGSQQALGTAGEAVETLEVGTMPAEVVGLSVEQEDVGETLSRAGATFIDGLALYSLRADDLVQATLQVSRFNDAAEPESDDFRRTVVNQIGASAPKEVRVGERTVYLTTGTKQSIAVWFTGRHMFVLASRADYDEPRTLLRQILEVQP